MKILWGNFDIPTFLLSKAQIKIHRKSVKSLENKELFVSFKILDSFYSNAILLTCSSCSSMPHKFWKARKNADLLYRLTWHKNLLCDTKIPFKWFVISSDIQHAVHSYRHTCEMTREMAHYVLVVCMCTHIFAKPECFIHTHIIMKIDA